LQRAGLRLLPWKHVSQKYTEVAENMPRLFFLRKYTEVAARGTPFTSVETSLLL